jgi:methylphosphotriester-DNA--protein-cysteine methyltransferase
VFGGREAKLNRTILQALARKRLQNIYDLHKEMKNQRGLKYTKYTNVNRMVKALEGTCFVERVGAKNTQAGFEATLYDITERAYLAMWLSKTRVGELIRKAELPAILTLLGTYAILKE